METQEDIAKIKKNLKIAKIAFILANSFAAITFAVVYYLLKSTLFLVFALIMVVATIVLIKFINRFEKKILNFENKQNT